MHEIVSFQCINCKSDGVLSNINDDELAYCCPNGCGIIIKINKFCNECNVAAVVNPIDESCTERAVSCPNCNKILYKININQSEKTIIHEQKQHFNQNNKPRGQCKYGLKCKNSSCYFEHPVVPTKPQLKSQQSSMPQMFATNNTRSFGPCRYGTTCYNVNCNFQHPVVDSQNTMKSQPSQTQGQGMSGKKRYCKFGMNCHKEGCTYEHPNVQDLIDGTIPPLELPPPATIPKLCKFGNSCARTKCMFLHPPMSSSSPLQLGTNKSDVNNKSMIPCKFGISCKKTVTCPFFHQHLSSQ